MKNTFGNALGLTIFGESHGAAVGAVLDGLAAGLPVDEAYIAERMDAAATDLHKHTSGPRGDRGGGRLVVLASGGLTWGDASRRLSSVGASSHRVAD